MWTESRRADMPKLIVVLISFVNTPKKWHNVCSIKILVSVLKCPGTVYHPEECFRR
jgi:hypothetical protein